MNAPNSANILSSKMNRKTAQSFVDVSYEEAKERAYALVPFLKSQV